MGVDDPARDREAEAGAAVARRAGGVDAVEALEHALGLLGRDARALVGDLDRRHARRRGVRAQPHATRPAGEWRTALSSRLATTWCSRSGSPIARRSPGCTLTCSHTGRAERSPSSHSRVACSSSVAHAERRRPQRQRAALQPRQVEQLRDEPAEPLGLGQRGPQRGRIGRLDAVDEVLQQRLQRAERRPQLVRDVGDELAPHAVDVGRARPAIALNARASSPTSSWEVARTRRP